MTLLGPNQYGKAETRLVRVARDGAVHHIEDLTVSVALSGEMAEVHLSGSNAAVLPTDTMKNTVYAFAREHGVGAPEAFGARLARHFVTSQPTIHRARVRLAVHAWDRIATPGDDAHSFVRAGRETRTAQVTFERVAGDSWEILSGLTGLTVLNSTGSEFRGYLEDGWTTLPETDDRILATDVTAVWRHEDGEPADEVGEWDASYLAARTHLLEAFAGTYSRSLQQTLYAMGSRVVDQLPGVEEIRLSLPNKHHFLVDLAPFGLANEPGDGAVYQAADRPYGLIEATVLRDGSDARIPADLTGGGLR
ncbi:factor-independent urate hydroxylase [Streptomyces radicis]|uniref:Uricase n=1 Tax=Streptomyces radicis TaxID=1750517 RepID=A0A3A9W132_9ACTN|nr:urate oxidase [Streptomyces radicis]RKN06971.1 urate oxidase [Streptomyces radicis]RKN15889.1 urate oxidase [Streptomyces radicis]